MQYVALILDDTSSSNTEMFNYFTQHDIDGIICYSIDETYKLLAERQIDIIIVQITTASEDHLQVIRKIKNSEYRDIPIIITTNISDLNYYLHSITMGASDYILKPFNPQFFIDRIQNLLKPKLVYVNESTNCIPVSIPWDFQDFIRTEFKRADRGDYPVSILIATINSDNDQLNPEHENFNYELINEFLYSLKLIFRETDTLVRFGSQSIIAILPFCSKSDLPVIFEKINSHCQSVKPLKPKFEDFSLVTCGLTYPHDGITRTEIFTQLEDLIREKLTKLER